MSISKDSSEYSVRLLPRECSSEIVSGCYLGSNVHKVFISVKIVLSIVSGCYTESSVHEVCLPVKIVLRQCQVVTKCAYQSTVNFVCSGVLEFWVLILLVCMTRRDGSRSTWHQPSQRCKYTTSVAIQKCAMKSYSLM